MKIRNSLLVPCFVLVVLPVLIACGVDRWSEYEEATRQDQWIDSVMRVDYLWYADMPSTDKLNYFQDPATFLKSALSPKDKSFSVVDSLIDRVPQPEYGYQYSLYRAAEDDTAFNALVTYILPESPASDAGLKRGDWIMKVNGNLITKKNEQALLHGNDALSLVVGKYTETINPEQMVIGTVIEDHTAQMPATRLVENNPVNYYNTYTSGGQKVGYIVYKNFTPGTAANPEKYDNALRTISQEFQSAGVTTVILDLRYNAGGEISSAQLISTMLAPASMLGQPMAFLEYNDQRQELNKTLLFDKARLKTGANLNLQSVIVLSTAVTAGSSETVINCLDPYMPGGLVLIGLKTVGQYVGTRKYRYPQAPWGINLVEYVIYNGEYESGFSDGLMPNYELDETKDLLHFLPFGDVNETLLNAALGVIAGTYPPAK